MILQHLEYSCQPVSHYHGIPNTVVEGCMPSVIQPEAMGPELEPLLFRHQAAIISRFADLKETYKL